MDYSPRRTAGPSSVIHTYDSLSQDFQDMGPGAILSINCMDAPEIMASGSCHSCDAEIGTAYQSIIYRN